MSRLRSNNFDLMKISDLWLIVECPPDIEINEWFKVHIIQFFNELSLLCAVIRSDDVICNEHSCPKMSVHCDYEYLWHSKEFVEAISVSAPKYCDFLLEWIEQIINEQFESSNLRSLICKICRRIARVYGHIYYAHYSQIAALQMDIHFNTSFQWFLYFVKKHKLVKDKELYPMRKIVKCLCKEQEHQQNEAEE